MCVSEWIYVSWQSIRQVYVRMQACALTWLVFCLFHRRSCGCVCGCCVRACVRDVMRVCLSGYISHAGVCACVHVSMNTYLACVLPVKAATNSKQV